MATKYYAPKEQLSVLTVSTSPGKLTYSTILNNLMRMILMDETEERERLSAEEAIAELASMEPQEYKELRQMAVQAYQDWDLQKYLEEQQIHEGMELTPATEILQEYDNLPTSTEDNNLPVSEEDAEEWIMSILDEYSLSELENQWLSGSPVRE